jgi:hypothetical protein
MYLFVDCEQIKSQERMNMIDLFLQGLLFLLTSFSFYWLEMTGKQSSLALFLLLSLPILGVFFLGWWALLTYFSGMFLGAKFFVQEINRE